jgi:hypothetical protein
MTGYTQADFTGLVGESFDVDFGGGAVLSLVLDKVEELSGGIREEGNFRLEYRGPSTPLLPQAIYRLARGEESWDIFLVPIGQNDSGTSYEACFY